MFLSYGGYQHDPGECEVQISQSAIRGPLGRMYATKHRWDILGRVHADTTAQVVAAVAALVKAYSVNGRDLVFNGSGYGLYSNQTINGTKVVLADFPKGSGAEFSTFRNYHFAVEAEYTYPGEGLLVSWHETISCRGTGGPIWGYIETLTGNPIQEKFCDCSILRATQRGSVVTSGDTWPLLWVPGPIWSNPPMSNVLGPEHQDLREITNEQPGTLYNERMIHWQYHFSFNNNPGLAYPRGPASKP
jgi:hypothetical protein